MIKCDVCNKVIILVNGETGKFHSDNGGGICPQCLNKGQSRKSSKAELENMGNDTSKLKA